MYKTHVKLQPAEGPVNGWWSPSYTDQFKYDAQRSNFDTYKAWYVELNKWIDHLSEVNQTELIDLQEKLNQKFKSNFVKMAKTKKAKQIRWKCPRKDCEVPVRMRKFMRTLDNEIQKNKDKEIRKELIQTLDIPQRNSAIDVVNDIINRGLSPVMNEFTTFCGDIGQNIHHIIYFMIFYVDKKDDKNQNVSQVTDMPDITTMPLKEKKDMNGDEQKAATELCKLYRAWSQSASVKPAEGRFLTAEAPFVAHILHGNATGYIFSSLLALIWSFLRFTTIAIAILSLVALLCQPRQSHQPSQPRQSHQPSQPSQKQINDEIRRKADKKYKGKKKKYDIFMKAWSGLPPIILLQQKFPTGSITILDKAATFWGACSICLDSLTPKLPEEEDPEAIKAYNEKLKKNVKCCNCGHCFHAECIEAWLEKKEKKENKTCPICREPCGEGLLLGKEHKEKIEELRKEQEKEDSDDEEQEKEDSDDE